MKKQKAKSVVVGYRHEGYYCSVNRKGYYCLSFDIIKQNNDLVRINFTPNREVKYFKKFCDFQKWILQLLENNGFYVDIVSRDFNALWYNILFVDYDNGETDRYGITDTFI